MEKNVPADFGAGVSEPAIYSSACVDHPALVIGNVVPIKNIMVSPMASVRGADGQPPVVVDNSNVQDGFVIHVNTSLAKGYLAARK